MATLSFTVNENLTLTLGEPLPGVPSFSIQAANVVINVEIASDPLVVEFYAPSGAPEDFFNKETPFTFAPEQPFWITGIPPVVPVGDPVSFTIQSVTEPSIANFLINLANGQSVDPTIINDPPG
jgi:hypothetical protein